MKVRCIDALASMEMLVQNSHFYLVTVDLSKLQTDAIRDVTRVKLKNNIIRKHEIALVRESFSLQLLHQLVG